MFRFLVQRNPGHSPAHIAWWAWFCRPLSWLGLWLLYRHRSFHVHRVPRTGGVLLLCNHQSYLDLAALGVALTHRHFHSMARSSLFHNPFFGWLIRSLNAFPVEQGKGDVAALRRAIELLKAGHLVLVFPEGSRSPDGALHEFAEGIMLLVRRAKPTVVPMAVDGTYDAWPLHQKLPRIGGRTGANYGQAIDSETLLAMKPADAVSRLRNEVESLRLELRAKLRSGSGGRFPAYDLGDVHFSQID